MTLRIVEHPAATDELIEAAAHYEALQLGLGQRFSEAADSAIDSILRQPHAWPKQENWNRLPIVRSRKISSFPYRVVYFVRNPQLIIVAYAHERRRPGYWATRISE